MLLPPVQQGGHKTPETTQLRNKTRNIEAAGAQAEDMEIKKTCLIFVFVVRPLTTLLTNITVLKADIHLLTGL